MNRPQENKGPLPMGEQILQDLSSRFIINLPTSEFKNINRFFYHLEHAWFFYLDFFQEMTECIKMFGSFENFVLLFITINKSILSLLYNKKLINVLKNEKIIQKLYNKYLKEYKYQIPVAGCIVLVKKDQDKDKWFILLQQNLNDVWGFPKGKQNYQEPIEETSIRETYEETGFKVKHGELNEKWFIQPHYTFFPVIVSFDNNKSLQNLKPQCVKEVKNVKLFEISRLLKDIVETRSNTVSSQLKLHALVKTLYPKILSLINNYRDANV